MARQIRIEFSGAMYHVMARGDRREPIVKDDQDRRAFVRTLGEGCERAGFRIHAWVLMHNHYHLLLETPEANLARGMGWLQNAYTRRINTRHRLWGHLFGGRYKSILVEPGNCFWALLDYIHLNPVRAGLVRDRHGLDAYSWSSLAAYIGVPGKRPQWLETAVGFSVVGCRDNATGRREFLGLLEKRVDWRRPSRAGLSFPQGNETPDLAIESTLRRGWFFGSQAFRERMLRMMARTLASGGKRREDGYRGSEIKDHGIERAQSIIAAGCKELQVSLEELRGQAKSDWRKALLAELVQSRTIMRLDWIRQALNMGDRSSCCRLIRQTRQALPERRDWRRIRKEIVTRCQ
jgi:putative transposase